MNYFLLSNSDGKGTANVANAVSLTLCIVIVTL